MFEKDNLFGGEHPVHEQIREIVNRAKPNKHSRDLPNIELVVDEIKRESE